MINDIQIEILEKRKVSGHEPLKAFIDVKFSHSSKSLTLYNLKLIDKTGRKYICLPDDVQEKIFEELTIRQGMEIARARKLL